MSMTRFTKNKQVVRDLQRKSIEKAFVNRLGELKYFGLPSEPWKTQHSLMLTAFKNGILSKTVLLRGDIDKIILTGKDDTGNTVDFPFDVISLDYSGGLLYRNSNGDQFRLNAIRKIIEIQTKSKKDYFLFVSTNLDNSKDREIKTTLENIKTDLLRSGYNIKEVIDAYLNHDKDEVRLKIYVPYFINQIATNQNYNCETKRVIFYLGNKDTHMMNFQFYLKYDPRTTAPRFPKEHLSQIFNNPMIEIQDGKFKVVSLSLPKLKRINE